MVKRDPLITLVRAVVIYNKYILDNMQIAQFLQEKPNIVENLWNMWFPGY